MPVSTLPPAERDAPARAILVGVDFGGKRGAFDESLDELALLAASAGDIAVAHAPEESVSIAELAAAVPVFMRLAQRMGGAA